MEGSNKGRVRQRKDQTEERSYRGRVRQRKGQTKERSDKGRVRQRKGQAEEGSDKGRVRQRNTRTQQQRQESPTVTLARHASMHITYRVHKLRHWYTFKGTCI